MASSTGTLGSALATPERRSASLRCSLLSLNSRRSLARDRRRRFILSSGVQSVTWNIVTLDSAQRQKKLRMASQHSPSPHFSGHNVDT